MKALVGAFNQEKALVGGTTWEAVGELRLGTDTELKKGRESGSWEEDCDLVLSVDLEISLEKEVRRNLGRYLGDLDLATVSPRTQSVLALASVLLAPQSAMMSSTASSTEDTLLRPPWRQ